MFDTHAHLNFKNFQGEVGSVIELAKKAGVTHIVVPGTDIDSSQKAVEIAQKHDGVYAAVGIHPHHAFGLWHDTQYTKHATQEIEKIEKLLTSCISGYMSRVSCPLVAIGEIGLDRYEYKKTKYKNYKIGDEFFNLQKQLFIAQLELAKKFKLSVIVHNREAKGDMLSLLGQRWDSYFERRMVFHCCEPKREILQFAKDRKLFIGVDGDVTYWKEKAEFIKAVPLDMLVLETDSPFLTPEPLRSKGEKNTPAHLPIIAEFVSHLKGESVEKVAAQTTVNAKKLFCV